MEIILAILAIISGAVSAILLKRHVNLKQLEEALREAENMPSQAPKLPQETSKPVIPPPMPTYDFSTPQKAYHSVRVICDEEGLALSEKNLICSVIYGESEFNQNARCDNKDSSGKVWSSDISICQINDYYHIGKGKTFPSKEYVMENQDKVVRWMIKMYRQGHLKWWVAYSSGRYKAFLKPNSAMFALKT